MSAPMANLISERLYLRPFAIDDAPMVRELAGAAEVAAMMLHIPHPYPEGFAERWIGGQRAAAERGNLAWAITRRETAGPGSTGLLPHQEPASAPPALGPIDPQRARAPGRLIGGITLTMTPTHQRADLGYWLGVPFWGLGYATEAARLVISYGFVRLQLHRIQARCFPRNRASARVLEKAGMRYEGLLRGYLRKGDAFEDALLFAILSTDRPQQARSSPSAT
jgi:RimJ/RimL family protein N-acetyltransferase